MEKGSPCNEEEFFGVDNWQVNEPYAEYGERDFTSLVAWQKARDVKLFFYNKILPALPAEEKYNPVPQIRRASISSTANIAEGYGRYFYKESIKFYTISRGSQAELKDHLISCFDLNYISEELFNEGLALISDSRKALSGYINYIRKQIESL